jgi:hypothetical protein
MFTGALEACTQGQDGSFFHPFGRHDGVMQRFGKR